MKEKDPIEAQKLKVIGLIESAEVPKDIIIPPISVDLFLCGSREQTRLPEEIALNPDLLELAAKRRELHTSLQNYFDHVKDPNMDIEDALNAGLVTKNHIAEIYLQLSNFLQADDNNARLIFYLPFQLLPNLDDRKTTDSFTETEDKFVETYFNAWIRLLFESDIRANFVDGDVLEAGMGEQIRVRKAAHLIPGLLEKGMLTTDKVLEIINIVTGDELLSSLAEGCVVARDKQLINDSHWGKIQEIGKNEPAINKVLKRLGVKKENFTGRNLTIDQIYEQLKNELAKIDNKYRPGSSYVSSMSIKRAGWEKGVRKDEAINEAVNQLLEKFQREEISIDDIKKSKVRSQWILELDIVGIRLITRTAEKYVSKNPEKAKTIVNQSLDYLNHLWNEGPTEIKDEITETMCHFRRLDLVQNEDLQRFGITLPDLSSLLPIEIDELEKNNPTELTATAKKISKDQNLSESLFPCFLVFGSRVKGYAKFKADLDLAIFVKPEASWDRREQVHKRLQALLPGLPERNEMPQIWLEQQQDGDFGFREVPKEYEDWVVTGPELIHFIFGGVWVGQGEIESKIRGDLVKSYLDLSRFKSEKEEMRFKFLRRLEMDILQYRLMHKGYRRFYPSAKQRGTINSDLIDWKSDFWDPRFRRIASKLFVSRVFLPDLS